MVHKHAEHSLRGRWPVFMLGKLARTKLTPIASSLDTSGAELPCSDDVYIVTPVETGDYEDGPLTVEPLYLVKVLSKASNKEVRSFKVPFCTAGETGQPIMVP